MGFIFFNVSNPMLLSFSVQWLPTYLHNWASGTSNNKGLSSAPKQSKQSLSSSD